MRLFILPLVLILFLSTGFQSGEAQVEAMRSTSVMTYNIQLDGCDDPQPSWMDRRSLIAQIIRVKSPEVLGLQGSSLTQLRWLTKNLTSYTAYHRGLTNDPSEILCPILYDSRVYRSMDQGTFSLEEALTAQGAYVSDSLESSPVLNWVKLEHLPSTGTLYVVNTSMGSLKGNAPDASIVSAMRKFIDNLVGTNTFVLLGDMAAEPESPFISAMCKWVKDSHSSSLVRISDTEDTFIGWENCLAGTRIDYVFLSQDIPANSHEVVDMSFQNRFPSDHLPVFCRLRLN